MSSDKSDEFSLEDLEDLDLTDNGEENDFSLAEDEGLELDLSGEVDDFLLSDEDQIDEGPMQDLNEFSLTNVGLNLSLSEGEEDSVAPSENFLADDIDLGDELKEEFSLNEGAASAASEDDLFSLESADDFSLNQSQELAELSDEDLFASDAAVDSLEDAPLSATSATGEDITEDIKAKLKEIDAIMEEDATNAALNLSSENRQALAESPNDDLDLDNLGLNLADADMSLDNMALDEDDIAGSQETDEPVESGLSDEDLFDTESPSTEESLVGDLNLSELDLNEDEFLLQEEAPRATEAIAAAAPTQPKKKKKKETESQSLEDISQAYSGEMERTQATISNLRADRDELLKRIDALEEEKLLSHRNLLSQRAELDEKKIELTIIRKKLNEEINELKDKIRIFEERVLILEEKNKQLYQELDTAGQKNRIDVKRVMLRERELEQKLELLKADAETQIRNRDLKILELKRKIDGMEFDMESISQHEKKTLESRFELEDKLDKAIRTLRSAISTLEEDGDRSSTLETIKKNIEV